MVLVAVGVGIAGTLIQGSFVNMCVVNVYHRGASLLTWIMPKKNLHGLGHVGLVKVNKVLVLDVHGPGPLVGGLEEVAQ